MEEGETTNILLCDLCNNWLDNPRYLSSCLHSFCENCLKSWIALTFEQGDSGIKCRTCNTITPVSTEDNLDSKDLTDKLPRNNFLSSLVEREKITASTGQVFCHPCSEEDGVKVNGSHWCQQCSEVLCSNCANFHKKVKNLATHKVYTLSEVQVHPEIISKAYELCEIHPEENLETYCYSHEEPCCVRCLVSKHRHCDDAVPIEQWVRETQNAQEPTELLQELDRRSRDDSAENSNILGFLDLNERITKMRTEIDDHLNKLEKRLRSEVSMFHKSTNNDNSKEILKFTMIYLKKLIKSGSTVQLFSNMKRIRTILASTENNKAHDESTVFIQFDEYLEALKDNVKSFGHIVSEKKKTGSATKISFDEPVKIEDEKRLPTAVKQDSVQNSERRSPAPQRRTEPTPNDIKPQPKPRSKNEHETVLETEHLDVQKEPRPPSKSSESLRRGKSIKLVDNIAEIERKLKIFIDKHITKINDGQSWDDSSENALDDAENKKNGKRNHKNRDPIASTAEDPSGYAHVRKEKKNDQHVLDRGDYEHNQCAAKRQLSTEGVQLRSTNKRSPAAKEIEPIDPEKEKLNALITSYLRKKDKNENENSLSNTKSFYFSNPDIPSAIKEDDKIGTVFEDQQNPRHKKRRNSLNAAKMDEIVIEDPDYDEINYDAPFLKSTYMSMTPLRRESNTTTSPTTTEAFRAITNDSDDAFETASIISEKTNDYQIYNPQSQLRTDGDYSLKSNKMPEKGEGTQKKSFFEKAKQKIKFHKKNAKFDVDQTTKNKIFYDDPMNEPIYIGTPYELPVKKAAHEVTTKKPTKESPYEENFQILYPDRKKDEYFEHNKKKDEEIYSMKRADMIQQRVALKPPPLTQDEYVTIKETEDEKIKSFHQNNTTETTRNETVLDKLHITREENQGTDTKSKIEERKPSLRVAGMAPSFLGELRQRLAVKPPEPGEHTALYDTQKNIDVTEDDAPTQVSGNAPNQMVLPAGAKPMPKLGVSIFPGMPNSNMENLKRNKVKSKVAHKMTPYETRSKNDFNVQSGNTLITGGVFNKKGKLLLIDSNEQKLYIFTYSADCQDVFYFKDKPWDITIVNENIIAVTFPDAEAIDLVDIAEMKIFKRLTVNESCYGIDFLDNDLVIRCSESIKIMNLHGTIVQSIRVQTDFYGYVACREDKIYYTHKSSLICIDKSGNQIFVFEDPILKRAEGIGIDFEGNIYVAGMDSNNVLQVSGNDGQQQRKIIPALVSPKAIVFSESLNRFFVTYDKTNVIIYDLYSPYGSLV